MNDLFAVANSLFDANKDMGGSEGQKSILALYNEDELEMLGGGVQCFKPAPQGPAVK